MRTFARLQQWAGAPQIFVVTALVATALLLVLELQTPWERTYRVLGEVGGFQVGSTARPMWTLLGSLLLVCAPLMALRSVTLGVVLALPRVAMGVGLEAAWPWTGYAALMAVAVCGSWRRPLAVWIVAALAVAQPMTIVATRGRMMTPGGSVEFGLPGVGGDTTSWLVVTASLYAIATVVIMLLPVLLRREASRQRDLFELVRGRREVAQDAAVLSERARLARDLHDVVAHHVSLIAVRAETAPYTYPDLSVEARGVLAEIADEARQALDELRGVLGILRRADGAPDRTPQPTAHDIERLVTDARSAGVSVTASLHGLDSVQRAPGYVAYRVVQEALTNARRHAPDAAVELNANDDGAGGIKVLVVNAASHESTIKRGQGLIGMAERVAASGGELVTEIRGDVFVVEAWVPGANHPGSAEPEVP